jgi:hypothetical protein
MRVHELREALSRLDPESTVCMRLVFAELVQPDPDGPPSVDDVCTDNECSCPARLTLSGLDRHGNLCFTTRFVDECGDEHETEGTPLESQLRDWLSLDFAKLKPFEPAKAGGVAPAIAAIRPPSAVGR